MTSAERSPTGHHDRCDALESYEHDLLAFDSAAAAEYARLVAARAAADRTMPVLDAQIAAICLANDAVLVTRNIRESDGCGLDLVNRGRSEEFRS